jgi:hypothetical protein
VVLAESTEPVEAVVVGPTIIVPAIGVADEPAPDATTSHAYPAGVPCVGAVQLISADVLVTLEAVTPVGGKHVTGVNKKV